MDQLRHDLRAALRSMASTPTFSLTVVVVLALGIGANSAIFNLLEQILLRQLPVSRPEELVLLNGPGAFRGAVYADQSFSYPMYLDLRSSTETFSGVLARFATRVAFASDGPTETVAAELVSGNYFEVLGLAPALGRLLQPTDEERKGAHPVVVLSHGFWTRRFGARDDVIGTTVRLNERAMTIVGVAPKAFHSIDMTQTPDVFVSLMMKAEMTPSWDQLEERRAKWLHLMARLAPGVTREQAAAQMNVVYRQLNERDVLDYDGASETFRQRFVSKRLEVLPGDIGRSALRNSFSTPLMLLMAMVGVVLLIACSNAANLLLARASVRQRELAVRLALGATQRQIVRQLVVESVGLAAAGGAAGIVISVWTGAFLIGMLPFENARSVLVAEPNARVLLFTAVVSLVTGVVFGLVPAWQASREGLTTSLKDDRVAGRAPLHLRLRKSLVVAQVALSLVLVVGAGLFARSLHNLRVLNPGFRVDRVLTMAVDPTLVGENRDAAAATFERIRDEVSAQPGVVAAGLASITILTGELAQATVRVDGYTPGESEDMNPAVTAVSAGFFESLDMSIVRGRTLDERDMHERPKVAVINETMARYFFKDADPVGRRFGLGAGSPTDIEIVGVVRDGKMASMRDGPRRAFYIPYVQDQELGQMTLYARMDGDLSSGTQLVREAVTRAHATVPVFGVSPLDVVIGESLFVDRLVSSLSTAFGLLAAALAAVGLYGVMSYAVERRRREIGVRLALGAERGTVLRMVLGEVAAVSAIGIALGLPASFALSRTVRAQLFELSPVDPLTFGAATAAIFAVALVAGLVPARRAAAVDPVIALRCD